MVSTLRRFINLFLGLFLLAGVSSTFASSAPREITWDNLIEEAWVKEVQAEMAVLGRLGFLQDGTEAANKAMEKLRKKWDSAPIVTRYLNQPIRIPGYVLPLDASRDKRREFLLVPYFGACIHSPPPPANQIILVQPEPTSQVDRMPESMETIWVEGELLGVRSTTSQGVTGYSLRATRIRPYEEASPRP
jgi:hypothetical protein